MPEGCELRVVADKLRPKLVDNVIMSYCLGPRAKVVGFNNLKCPATIISVISYGKKLLIYLNTGYVIIVSLGMVGRLQYTEGNHSHVKLNINKFEIKGSLKILRQEFNLYFDDYRYIGGVNVIPNININFYFKDIGPDLLQLALDEKTWISQDTWMQIFNPKRVKNKLISNILLDQSFVAGIGKYLETEILYYSGIHPKRKGGDITYEEWNQIRINAHKIVVCSYSYGGLTIKDFISPDGKPGLYPSAIYGKKYDPLGYLIINEHLTNSKNSRMIHYVPEIQI